jgi:hypothetical protein
MVDPQWLVTNVLNFVVLLRYDDAFRARGDCLPFQYTFMLVNDERGNNCQLLVNFNGRNRITKPTFCARGECFLLQYTFITTAAVIEILGKCQPLN